MMSIGQSLAQMVHLMQRSSSSRNMPRQRCDGSQRSSGYSTVTGFFHMFLKVMPRPANRSRSMILSANRFSALNRPLLNQELHQPGDEDVRQRERDHPFPAQIHELIEAVAREGAAEPDVREEEDGHLEEEPDRPGDRVKEGERRDVGERPQPAAEEQRRRHR